MTQDARWAQIPLELRERAQWCSTFPGDPNPKRRKAPRKKGNSLASDVCPGDWMTFEDACANAIKYGGDIGYVLTPDDPFTCIDLDVKDATTHPNEPEQWTTAEDFDRYWRIVQAFNCYTELSRSGKGLHIWVRGNIGRGLRRDGVEIYSQERFIICTGSPVLHQPIRDHTEMLLQMAEDIRRIQKQHDRIELDEFEETETDYEIIERAMSAANSDKFNALCMATSCHGPDDKKVHGSYTELGYATQSEADLALMSMFTFYSNSNAQCRRLFRMSYLGQREKAIDDDRYLDFTLTTIRSRQAAAEKAERADMEAARELAAKLAAKAAPKPLLHVPGGADVVPAPPPAPVAVAAIAPVTHIPEEHGGLSWPPGMAGEIAKFIYHSAPRPVREVAIVSALGFLAGVAGKAFSIPQSGLNMYIVLIARSAIGKEALHSGISAVIQTAAKRQPPAMKFVDFTEYASGPALKKAVMANPCFLNVSGEWGRRLKRLADEDGRDGPMSQLRTVMTDLYQKSGPRSIVGGMGYSNAENNVQSVMGVAYSMIGESTPGRFYQSLTHDMMEDGFLSRFLIIEYDGDRPPLNEHPVLEPSKVLGDALGDFCTHALTLLDRHENVQVSRTNSASVMMRAFEKECDAQINGTQDEMWRQMWNRASLKMMRLAALLAVGDNWLNPVIEDRHVLWSLDCVKRDIQVMTKKIGGGEVGLDDDTRERKLVSIISDFLTGEVPSSYDVKPEMKADGIVPRKFLQLKTCRAVSFTNHRSGATAALEATLRSLCDNGYLMELDKNKQFDKYGVRGKSYRVLSLPNYEGVSKSK